MFRRVLTWCGIGSCGYQLVLLRKFRKMIVIGLKIYDFITEKNQNFLRMGRSERRRHRKESERRGGFSQIGAPIWDGKGFSLNGL